MIQQDRLRKVERLRGLKECDFHGGPPSSVPPVGGAPARLCLKEMHGILDTGGPWPQIR
jgi:hypothetical protein